ncbi:MAG: HAMP domain-containing sensor histidine kinase [Candidatus Krumholzibacteriia bacterium]
MDGVSGRSGSPAIASDFPFFRATWGRVVGVLLVAALVPLTLLGGGLYLHAAHRLEAAVRSDLVGETRACADAVDASLLEKKRLLALAGRAVTPLRHLPPQRLSARLDSLRAEMPGITDVVLLGAGGRRLGHAGPSDPLDRDDADALWNRTLSQQDRAVTDVSLDRWSRPRFMISVRLPPPDDDLMLCGTTTSEAVELLLGGSVRDHGGDAHLVNRDGRYQTRSARGGQPTDFSRESLASAGDGEVHEVGDDLVVQVALRQVPWSCVTRVPRATALAGLHRLRNTTAVGYVVAVFLVVLAVLLTTNELVARLEREHRRQCRLDRQLRRFGHVSSSQRLTKGMLEETRDALANLDLALARLADLGTEAAPGERAAVRAVLRTSLDRCCRSVDRALGLNAGGPPARVVTALDLNQLVGELVELLARETRLRCIRFDLDLAPDLPRVRGVCPDVRQICQQLLLNAVDAVGDNGSVRVRTQPLEGSVELVVSDSGPGIPEGRHERIFTPLYTTRSDALGLGLTLSREIAESIGGRLEAGNEPGGGARLTLILPAQGPVPVG